MHMQARGILHHRRRGASLVEAVLAAALLAMAVLAVFSAIGSGAAHAEESARRIAATMAAESLLAQVTLDRGEALDAWHGHSEPLDTLTDLHGRPLPPSQQVVSRSVRVRSEPRSLPGFEDLAGRCVVVEARGFDERVLASVSAWIPDEGGLR
ncbi:MAG: hypothetical protein MK085_01750 [Phycisphaerales bacterium]|nr:hypothetical protein [Phycisphaerales bacterium]